MQLVWVLVLLVDVVVAVVQADGNDTTTASANSSMEITRAAPPRKACRHFLSTACNGFRPACVKDCTDQIVQVLPLQEAQDAYIAQRGLPNGPDALGLYLDYRSSERLMLDTIPRATEWLFLGGLQLNGKQDFYFPEVTTRLTTVFLAGNRISSIEKVNFPDQLTTIKLIGTSTENLTNARFPSALELLDASSNQIKSLVCCGFPDSLRELYLAYNALERLQHIEFPPALETLSVNWNRISTIRNVTFPSTLTRLYFVENPIQLISLSTFQWERFLNITGDFVTLDGGIPNETTTCVSGFFGPNGNDEFLACLLGEEPVLIDDVE